MSDALAELPNGVLGEIGAVPHVLARAGAHPALEALGLRPFLFDLPTFILVKGGEYLFVPGLTALAGLIERRF